MASKKRVELLADPVNKIACRKCGRHLDVSKLPAFSLVECPDCSEKQNVPAQLGPFLLLEPLGMGGMGAVYKALDQSLGRYVALKVMRRSLGEDKKFVENFLSEARAAAALNHRNVVSIYSFGEEQGQPYMVMELVDGGKLDEIIADGNPMDEVRALEIGLDVAEGLKAANDISLVHGDIKPANILFDHEGIAKVADFGLARFANWDKDGGAGEVWGTPYYIAPEKAKGQKVDHRADIYSMGATLYHVLGAKPPFDGNTATDVVLARLKNPAIGLRVIRPELQPETADLIARMLEADPFMRYPTYSSLLADMHEALRVAKQQQRGASVRKSTVAPVLIIIGIIVAAVSILLGSLWWKRGDEEVAQKDKKPLVISNLSQLQDLDKVRGSQKKGKGDGATKEAGAAVGAEKHAPVHVIVQPFKPEDEDTLKAAADLLAAGKAAATEERLQSLFDRKARSDIGRYWIRVLQGIAATVDGRPEDAKQYFEFVLDAEFPAIDGERPHPGMMPQTIAQYMLGNVDDGKLYFEAGRWPAWYRHLTQFVLGLDMVTKGRVSMSKSSLSEYAGQQGVDGAPQWPYVWQPVAESISENADAWEDLRIEVRQFIKGKRAEDADAALDLFEREVEGVFGDMVGNAREAVRQALEREAEQARIAAFKEHQEKVQKDLDLIDEVRTANLPLVARKDFRKAAAQTSKILSQITTPEGNQSLLLLRQTYERMNELKGFLIKHIKTAPFRNGRERVVDANLSGIQVALGAHGALLRPWEQVDVPLMLKMSKFYIENADMSTSDTADKYVSLAAYSYAAGGFKTAGTFVRKASEIDEQAKTNIRKLMPDLLEE